MVSHHRWKIWIEWIDRSIDRWINGLIMIKGILTHIHVHVSMCMYMCITDGR